MNRNVHLATAIAAILGSAGAAQAATPPTLAQAAAAAKSIYVGGSSAAKNAVLAAVKVNLCGGVANALTITSTPNTNFGAVSCAPAAGVAGANGTEFFTVYYRFEGGSVTGVLPIANNDAINQLSLTATSFITCADVNNCTATVTGTSAANGTTDTFGGAVGLHAVQMGISDVEPAALTGKNYPTPYSTTAWGPVNPAGVAAVPSSALFDEVYGIFVNTGTTAGISTPLNLSTQMVANILTKKVVNWSQVTDTAGTQVSSTSIPIVIVNREVGSGSRAATDLLITGDSCQVQGAAIKEASATATDYFSTGDVLTALNSQGGGISYASIDNAPQANETLVNLNGDTPSALHAAGGSYPFWVEAVTTSNPNSVPDAGLSAYLTTTLQTIATAPHLADILAIPGIGSPANVAHVNVATNGDVATGTLTGLGSATIYTNPFTRNKVTCAIPQEVGSVQ